MKVDTISQQLFFTTIRIETDGGKGSGTGFFFKHKVGDGNVFFVVTNKHVVMNAIDGQFFFHIAKDDLPELGNKLAISVDQEYWKSMWFGHPDPSIDIAIFPIFPLISQAKDQGFDVYFRSIDADMIPDDAQLDQLDAIETVTFIGYPNGIWDEKNALPIARRGTTASPMQVDFDGTPRFLIDASVFGGSSGSPVFLLKEGPIANSLGMTGYYSRFHFLGVVAAVFFRTQLNQIISVPIPTQTNFMAEQQEMIDLGIVFKSRTVVETIEACMKANPLATSSSGQPHA